MVSSTYGDCMLGRVVGAGALGYWEGRAEHGYLCIMQAHED
jgi:hypothetical protein